jgi:transcriptional regulator with XRE-family HTH domain
MTLRTAQQATQFLVSAGHPQKAIADRVGVSQATISRILSGEFKDPAGSTLIKLNEFADEVEATPAHIDLAPSTESQPH